MKVISNAPERKLLAHKERVCRTPKASRPASPLLMPASVAFSVRLVLAFCCVASGGRRTTSHGADPPVPPPSQFSSDASHVITIGVSITPGATVNGVTVDEGERMQVCEAALNALEIEFSMRHSDGHVPYAVFSRERGTARGNPHIQAAYDLNTTAHTTTELAALIKQEHAWLKVTLDGVFTRRYIVSLKHVKAIDRIYAYGYLLKDQGQGHFMFWYFGFTPQELQDALNVYRAKAGTNIFASKKMNKAPTAEEKQLSFGTGNLFVLATWFIHQHGLEPLKDALNLALTITYALETARYRVEETVVTGRNGGVAIDPVRSQAMFALGLADHNNTKETYGLVTQVLYGDRDGVCDAAQECRMKRCRERGIPTTTDLVKNYNLAAAKDLAKRFASPSGPRATGRFIVLDFLSLSASANARDHMLSAGLYGRTIFTNTQRPNICGYLSAGWACEMRNLAPDFDSFDGETAETINSPEFVQRANLVLGKESLGSTGDLLTGDEILRLAAEFNPDVPIEPRIGADGQPIDRSTKWLSGPAPYNHWMIHFDRTLMNAAEKGVVHIMVVNSESVYSVAQAAANGPMGGVHWFLVAWFIDPDDTDS